MYPDRVVSGMRPTGAMHLGHYHGALKNWVKMQSEVPCLFFVADWHALTTHYDDPSIIERSTWDMLVDWLASGVDPSQATLFIQSKVPEHAELHLLLSMATPLGWLERVPTYKDQIEKLAHKDLTTYGFLGYPLLQAADVLIYRASDVPVGDDQVPHVEMMREIARRFNYIYGKEKGFDEKAQEAVKKLGSKRAKLYAELRTAFQQEGKAEALDVIEILPATGEFYDFDAKYAAGGSIHVLPAQIKPNIYQHVQEMTVRAHEALGCRGVSRADFRYDDATGTLVCLEVNTQPGMTETSLVPELAAQKGLSFGELVEWMVEDASVDR